MAKHSIKIKLGAKSYYGCANKLRKDDRRQSRYRKQRDKRGFDDTETWSLDTTLAKFLLPRLKRFIEVNVGRPIGMSEKRWDMIIKIMIRGFELHASGAEWRTDDATESIKIERRIKSAWRLLGKYGRHLWW